MRASKEKEPSLLDQNRTNANAILPSSSEQKTKKKTNKKLKTAKSTFLRTKTNFRFPQKKFEDETLDRGINLLIYGKKLLKFCKNGKIAHYCCFYILEDSPNYLQWLSNKKIYGNSRLDLTKVTNISDDPTSRMTMLFKRWNHLLCITYENSNQKEVDMLIKFPNEETKLFWWQGIQYFIKRSTESNQATIDQRKIMAQKLFLQADKDGSKTLNFDETKKILQKLHIEITKDYLKHLFEKYDKDKNNSIDLPEFHEIIADITQKKEIIPLFQEFSEEASKISDFESIREKEIMKEEELLAFFKKTQKESMNLEEIRALILFLRDITSQKSISNFFDTSRLSKEKLKISISEFSTILFALNNKIFDPEKEEVYQSMDHPLSDYYINSSHNTYLMANQLTGESSTKAYINAFLRGVRCVELDCWDGEKGEPIIYHGFTLTSKITFEEVIKTINDDGFKNNPYPIILSIENHCKDKQQERMADILIKILGDKLFTLPQNYKNFEYYPSPNQLKNKIIIKDKGKLSENSANKINMMENSDISVLEQNEETSYLEIKLKNFNEMKEFIKFNSLFERYDYENRYTPHPKPNFNKVFSKEKKSTILSSKHEEFMIKKNSTNEIFKDQKDQDNSKKFFEFGSKNYSSQDINSNMVLKKNSEQMQGGYLSMDRNQSNSIESSGMKIKVEDKSPAFQKILGLFGIKMKLEGERSVWNISSINEEKISKLLKDKEVEIIDFHRKYFTRIYPAGKRVDSSNYDPIDAFNSGSQLIALNVQTHDNSLLLYFSKFMENGGINSGYVLKPKFMLHNAEDVKYIKDFKKMKKILNIKVISGQQLRPEDENDVRDVADPYVEVSLRGCAKDEAENSKTFKSITVKNNGFNPVFNLECDFKIYCPDLCLIVFKVFDEEGSLQKDMKLGWYAIPFNCIRQGYRIVPLLNSHLNPIEFSYLFCHISIQDVI